MVVFGGKGIMVREIKGWICERCLNQYKTEIQAEQCENSHSPGFQELRK